MSSSSEIWELEDWHAEPPSLGRNGTIQLRGHDEIVLVQALDLVGVKRHGGVAPAEGDVRLMALSLGQISSTLHEPKRLGEVLEPKRALDPVRIIEQSPLWRLAQVRLGLIGREG